MMQSLTFMTLKFSWQEARQCIKIILKSNALQMSQAHQIRIPVSPGELIDKITILSIKKDRIVNPNKLHYIVNEIESFSEILDLIKVLLDSYDFYFDRLKGINQQLWDIEDDLRAKEASQCFDKEFIEKARLVYKLNDKRAALKLEINQILGSNIAEQKQHPSYNI